MNKNPYPGLRQLKDQSNSKDREKRLMEAKSDLAGQMKAWCDRHNLTPDEALALCAYMTGTAIALQDQRTMSGEMAMKIVVANIEAGNQTVIAELLGRTGGSA